MESIKSIKEYDLEERTYRFARNVAFYIKDLKKQLYLLNIQNKLLDHLHQLEQTI